jgi:hypothetical protein
MVKFRIGCVAVPLLVTLASVPGAPVVVVPTVIVVPVEVDPLPPPPE